MVPQHCITIMEEGEVTIPGQTTMPYNDKRSCYVTWQAPPSSTEYISNSNFYKPDLHSSVVPAHLQYRNMD